MRPRPLGLAALALALVCATPPAPAHAYGLAVGGVLVDPEGSVRRDLLQRAVAAWRAHPEARRDLLVAVDFGQPSNAARFHLIDMRTGRVASYLTAHGKGSDANHDGQAESFSNAPNSLASSLGAYLTATRYHGRHGLSLRLKGLEESNSEAEARAIVLHSAPYMGAAFRARHGRPGRSFGCFVVEPHLIEEVVDALEGGVVIFAGA